MIHYNLSILWLKNGIRVVIIRRKADCEAEAIFIAISIVWCEMIIVEDRENVNVFFLE